METMHRKCQNQVMGKRERVLRLVTEFLDVGLLEAS